ncbi:MAG: PBP1A family penicillin-binding protein [Acidobacteria bacterium]|nr:PBP1A family penicillin-binding protein [Acidobacteriota bacterium]
MMIYVVLVLTVAAAAALLGTLLGYEYNLPRIQSLEDYRPDVITDVYSDDNKVIGEFAVERRIIVPSEEIPRYLQLAIIAAEDDQFYHHGGVNYLSVLRAAYRNLTSMRKAEGFSTITMQLARMLLGAYEKTYDRKIKELLIARKIERQYTKQQILTLYCNQHYMGQGAYGVAAAADTYFGKPLKDLTLEECALIAALPRNPGLYSPRLHPQAALARRNYVLDRMVEERMIPARLAAEAKTRPIILKPRSRNTDIAPYFVEWVRQSLAARYSTDDIWRKGLRVYTTLNIRLQQAANRALRDGLMRYDKRHGWRGPADNILKSPTASLADYQHPDWRFPIHEGDIVVGLVESSGDRDADVRIGKYRARIGSKEIAWTRAQSPAQILKPGDIAHFRILSLDELRMTAAAGLEQMPKAQGALVAVENATGEIKAMVGGFDFESSEFNRATQALRQVGSTFKPFVYTVALEHGMDLDSTVMDAPIGLWDGLGRLWEPTNYDGEFKGLVTLRQALVESRNVPTVKTAEAVGINEVVVMARRFGLSARMDPYLPLALGACEATPLEIASAFTVFPNLGFRAKPYFIRRIEDYGRVKREENLPVVEKVLDPGIAEQMLRALQGVVEQGTAKAARSLRRPVGGKTGTTNDFTDAWFVGFTPSLTVAVWVGFDAKVTLGSKEAGAVAALPIWIDYMQEILKETPVENFAVVESTEEAGTDSPEITFSQRRKLFVEELPAPPAPKN